MNKTTVYLIYILRRTWLLTALILFTAQTTGAQTTRQYTDSNPLIIAVDWDFPPLEFSNSNNGNPDGYHVEVMEAILKKLKIPYKFVMNARRQCIHAFESHEADLIFDYGFRFQGSEYVRSQSIFNYYRLKVASKKDTPPITSIEQQSQTDPIVLNSNNDSIASHILRRQFPNARFEYHSPREALAGVANGTFKYFVWGEIPLKWKINELGINELVITDIKANNAEAYLIGYDKALMNEIDNQFARMEQSGEISQLKTKWFYPERIPEHTSSKAFYFAVALFLALILIYILYRFTKIRVKVAVSKNEDSEAMMHRALSMGSYSVMAMDVQSKEVRNLHGKILPDDGMTQDEFLSRIHPADDAIIRKKYSLLEGGASSEETIDLRWNAGKPKHPVWRNIQGNAIAEPDDNGNVRNIIITVRDTTNETQLEQHNQQTAERFLKMFEGNLIGMSFYDKDGFLLDMNDNMRKMCCIKPEGEEYFKTISMFDAPLVKGDYPKGCREELHTCQHMFYPEAGVDIYIEFRITPIFDDNNDLQYYNVTAIDISEDRNIYERMRKHEKDLQHANEVGNTYEQRLRTLMESCNMYVWRCDIASGILAISHSLRSKQYTETLEEYVGGMYEDERQAAIERTRRVIANKEDFNVLHHYWRTPVTDQPAWFISSGMPLIDDKGNLTHLFGIVRNVTDLMEIQEKLKKETARANDSGRLKSAFLANMTHEIRTPLNAIVGFSDLLHDISAPEDRMEFIRIIRNNCDMLLRLINDIIEASTMDSNPISIDPAEVDFATVFNDICQSLAQRVQEPGVQFITDNPYSHLHTTLDKGRMQQVLTNFVTNAVKYTHEGHIKVGYRYQDEGIYMYCEDTGAGIPTEKQEAVFERFVKLNDFVQGTGLGLSICKSIADRCGGRIGVNSEGEGKGSTFWIWIPCEKKEEQTTT